MSDSEKYVTKLQDGELAVKTVAQTGEIIDDRPGDKYWTALVQTADGPQECVKTASLGGGGGGGGGTVDQTYDPTSTNAQSGTAVVEAVAPALKNNSSASSSITINSTSDITTKTDSVIIKPGATDSVIANNQVTIGKNAGGTNTYTTSVGYSAQTRANYCTALGASSNANGNTGQSQPGSATAIGYYSNALGGTALGSLCNANSSSTAIGRGFNVSHKVNATSSKSIAIGIVNNADDVCDATANEAIQLGNGTNSASKTFQVYSYQLLDGNTGKIPDARLDLTTITGYDSTKTQTLKHVSGVLQWVDD